MRFHQSLIVKFITLLLRAFPYIAVNIIIAKMLTPALKGQFEIAVLIPIVLAYVLNIGIPLSNIYYTAKNKRNAKYIAGNSLLLNFFATVIIYAVLYFYLGFILKKFYPDVNINHVKIALIAQFFLLNFNALLSIYLGKKEFIKSSVFELLFTLIWFLLAAFLFIIRKNSIELLIIFWVCNIVVNCIIILIFIIKEDSISFSSEILKDQISYGLKVYAVNIILILNYKTDLIMLGAISGMHYTGVYSVTIFLSELISKPISYMATVFFPQIVSNADNEKNSLTAMVSRFTFFITIAAGLIILFFNKLIINLFFDKSYYHAINTLIFLIPGIIFYSVVRVLAIDTNGRGETNVNIAIFSISYIINIILNLILIPHFNDAGAAISTSISYIITFIFFLLFFKFKRKININDILLIKKSDIKLINDIITGYKNKFINRN